MTAALYSEVHIYCQAHGRSSTQPCKSWLRVDIPDCIIGVSAMTWPREFIIQIIIPIVYSGISRKAVQNGLRADKCKVV